LERRRPAIVQDDEAIRAEVRAALSPVRREYGEHDLPKRYLDALERELLATIPARWRRSAEPFTTEEAQGFGIWRGGDIFARLTYLGVSAAIGFFIVWAPFIPIWEKWLPFAMAGASWFLPDLQVRFKRRRYARELGEIVLQMDLAQRQIERQITSDDILDGVTAEAAAEVEEVASARGDAGAPQPAGVERLRARAAARPMQADRPAEGQSPAPSEDDPQAP
jgi:hypothetical protein